MADKKNQLMAQFYETCQKQGYTDMTDATQSLKAKVIATDMKLKYGEFVAFYDKAKLCYEEILAEKAASDEETKRRSVDGSLLVTLSDGSSDLKVYVRPDNTIYTVYGDGEKEEGTPTFEVSKGGTLDYTYRPSKAVYTGATVGGITTGGVHYTKAGYEEKINKSNTGIVTAKTKNQVMSLKNAQISDSMREAFKRDPQYQEYAGESGRIVFSRSVSQSSVLSSISGGGSFHDKQSNLSHAIDASRMPYNHCVSGVNLLERVIRRQLPPSDERLYQKADSLAQSDSSESILNAAKQFEVISDYKDSAERAKELRKKYELVLQAEKENAILEKEAAQKRNKKIAMIAIPILIVCIIAAVFINRQIREAALLEAYNDAIALMEAGSYDDAVTAFEALENYENSSELILEASYRKALSYMEQGQYTYAINIFEKLDGYKESNEQILLAIPKQEEESSQEAYDAALKLAADGKYEAACQLLKELGDFSDSRQQLDLIAEQWCQEMIAEINTIEAGILWVDASDLRYIIQATGGYEKAQKIYDYFGTTSTQDDTLYQRIKMACVEGNLHEAKVMLEESDLLELKPVKTLYDAVVLFSPYCGDFVHSSGDSTIFDNIKDEPVDEVHTWVKFIIDSEWNYISGFELWIKLNNNQYGAYHYGDYKPDNNYFFRGISKTFDYTAELNESGELVFKKYSNGQLDNPKITVVYVLDKS